MSHIDVDFEQVVTAEQRATEANEARKTKLSAECRRGIVAVADETAQINLTAAASAGLLSAGQMQTWIAALGWVSAMRGEYARAAMEGDEPIWPDVPAGVVELVELF